MRKIHHQGWDSDLLRKLGLGKVVWKQCGFCKGSGVEYWDGSTGEGVSGSPSGIDPEHLDKGPCEDCDGIGFHFYEDRE